MNKFYKLRIKSLAITPAKIHVEINSNFRVDFWGTGYLNPPWVAGIGTNWSQFTVNMKTDVKKINIVVIIEFN